MTTITSVIVFTRDNTSTVTATLTYSDDNPYAVEIVFHGERPENNVTWIFARLILIEGLEAPAGLGDIQITPEDTVVTIRISSRDGTALLRTPSLPLLDFIQRSLRLVPEGKESVDIDALLAHLLEE